MGKKLIGVLLLVIAIQATLQDDFTAYNFQGEIDLVDNIQNAGYSPDQRNLVILTSDATDTFVFYESLRLTTPKTVTIVDDGIFNVKPSAFAFSKDSQWLLIGTTYGAVYVYEIVDGEIADDYSYKSHIATAQASFGVTSISMSDVGIAVAAKDKLVILTVPTDPKQKELVKKQWPMPGKIASVAWKHKSQNIVIVGGYDTPAVFHIVDITTGIAKTIETTTSKTTSIGVFPDDTDGTILQGRFESEIQIFTWDKSIDNYKAAGIIGETVNATEISISASGLYFAAEFSSTATIRTWKSGLTVNSDSNLQNHPLKAIAPSNLTSLTGKNLALASDGNRILVIGNNKTALKYNLCEEGKFYEGETCKTCPQTCGSCFNEQNCEKCKDDKEYIDNANACQPCSNVVDGCEICSSGDKCTGCNTGEHWQVDPKQGECQCIPTYFKQGTTCELCSVIDHCDECSARDKCQKCKDEDNINTQAKDGKCVCIDGWYFDTDLKCQDCTLTQTGCKECDSQAVCTLCDDVNNWIANKEGKCVCKDTFWRNGEACQSCSTIDIYCTQCSQDGKCLDCSNNRDVNETTGACDCKDHTYEDQTKVCEPCDTQAQCLECDQVAPHTCTLCDNITQHRKPNPNKETGKCECQRGFSEDVNNLCIPCDIVGCEDCNIAEDKCTTCFQEKNFDPTPNEDKQCVCLEKYYLDKITEACFTCDYRNPGCTTCQSLDQCSACDGQANFQPTPNTETHLCECISTFFLDVKVCKGCSAQYLKCETCNAQACLTCQADHHLTDEKKKCLTCSEAITGCDKCDSVQKCTECNAQGHWQLNEETNKCHCPSGYLEKEKQCHTCSSLYGEHCTECNHENCTSCQETFSFNEESNICFCPDDKEIKEGKCEDKSGLSALAIIAIIVGILALAGGAVALIKCFKKRQSPLEDGEYEALEGEKGEK